MAYEPAYNLYDQLRRHCEVLYPDFFPPALKVIPARSVDLVTSIACFYSNPDPHSYCQAVYDMLAPGGLWIVQMQDLQQMLAATAFDNICFEHLGYYTLGTFDAIARCHGLCIEECETRAINGGSLRFYIRKLEDAHPHPSVEEQIHREEGCDSVDAMGQFAWRVGQMREQIRGLVDRVRSQGQQLDLYAASTKSSTLMQYCGLDCNLIRWAVERSPEKVGRLTSGTLIPIVSEETWRASHPTVALIGAWQFKDAILKREAAFLTGGGDFIVPLPYCEVVCGA
jgi:NDP-4-keto-2,6-dideoxyhexose 3-C-methyltransferase